MKKLTYKQIRAINAEEDKPDRVLLNDRAYTDRQNDMAREERMQEYGD